MILLGIGMLFLPFPILSLRRADDRRTGMCSDLSDPIARDPTPFWGGKFRQSDGDTDGSRLLRIDADATAIGINS